MKAVFTFIFVLFKILSICKRTGCYCFQVLIKMKAVFSVAVWLNIKNTFVLGWSKDKCFNSESKQIKAWTTAFLNPQNFVLSSTWHWIDPKTWRVETAAIKVIQEVGELKANCWKVFKRTLPYKRRHSKKHYHAKLKKKKTVAECMNACL